VHGAIAVLNIELTLPKLVQTVIITRESARVPMEGSIKDYASFIMKGVVLVIYAAVHLIDKVVKEFSEAGVPVIRPWLSFIKPRDQTKSDQGELWLIIFYILYLRYYYFWSMWTEP